MLAIPTGQSTFRLLFSAFQILRDNIQGGLAHDLLIVGKASDIPVFVLQFFYDTIVYAEEAKELYVYNEASGVWCGPSPGDGNSLFLAKIERLNNVYRTSLSAIYNYRRMEKLKLWLIDNGCADLRDPAYTKEEEKQNDICKALNSKRHVHVMLYRKSKQPVMLYSKPKQPFKPQKQQNKEP